MQPKLRDARFRMSGMTDNIYEPEFEDPVQDDPEYEAWTKVPLSEIQAILEDPTDGRYASAQEFYKELSQRMFKAFQPLIDSAKAFPKLSQVSGFDFKVPPVNEALSKVIKDAAESLSTDTFEKLYPRNYTSDNLYLPQTQNYPIADLEIQQAPSAEEIQKLVEVANLQQASLVTMATEISTQVKLTQSQITGQEKALADSKKAAKWNSIAAWTAIAISLAFGLIELILN